MSKTRIALALLALSTLAAGLLWLQPSPDEPAAQITASPAVLTVTAVTAERRPLQRTLTATGSLHAWQELAIAPQLGGYPVTAVNAEIGDQVRAGQELARLDTDQLSAELRVREAALAKAEALAARATADYRRAERLSGQQLLSAADLERLDSERLAAQADVKLARANVEIARLNLQQISIVAPTDGIVSARSVNLGEIAQAGTPMFHLLRDGRVEWRAEVPESRLEKLERGQQVRLQTAAGVQLAGTVRTVAPSVDMAKRTALVYVDLPASESARPGMFARGEFLLGTDLAVMVPLGSIVRNDGYSYVFALGRDGTVERRRIETGEIAGDWAEVTGGLGDDERIVHRGAAFLKEGDRVDISDPGAIADREDRAFADQHSLNGGTI